MHEHSCCMMSYPVDNSKLHTADSFTLTLAQYMVYPGAALHAVFTASRMSFPIPSDACSTIFSKGFMTGLAYGASGRFWAPPMYILRVQSVLTEGERGRGTCRREGERTNGATEAKERGRERGG